jgi:hypothetical protein
VGGGRLQVPGVLAFIDAGRDVLIATDHTASHALRELAMECGVDFSRVPSPVRSLRTLCLPKGASAAAGYTRV